VAQIVKRTGNFDASDKAEIQKGLLAVLGPKAAESYRLRVEGVSADEDRQLSIDWAWQPSGQLPASNPSDFFGTVLSADRGGVIVRIEQDFKSLFETGGFGVFRLSASHAASSTTASRIVSQ
jgi:hypothetical protein